MSDTQATPTIYPVSDRAKKTIAELDARVKRADAELKSYLMGIADSLEITGTFVYEPKQGAFVPKKESDVKD